jgi:hypothetical protein
MTLDIVGISEMQKCGLKYVMQTPSKRRGDFMSHPYTLPPDTSLREHLVPSPNPQQSSPCTSA